MTDQIRFIDLFSGIGGFRLGLERANDSPSQPEERGEDNGQGKHHKTFRRLREFRCVWSNDFNKYASQIYTKNFGEENHVSADIRGVAPGEIPDFDLLCAGFPCQSFSVAGKRKGFQETRGTLFFEILRIAAAKRPSLLLLENVKGLLNHDGGRTFTIILQALDELGYWVEWQVLNSKYHGVPQNRERVFIVGHLRGTGGREVFPIGKNGKMAVRGKKEQTVRSLTAAAHSGGLHSDMTIIIDPYNQNIRKDGLAGTIKGEGVSPYSLGTAILTPERKEKRQHGRRFKEPEEPMFTLTEQDVHGVYIQNLPHGYNNGFRKQFPNLRANRGSQYNELLVKNARIRRLTPVECERLQGFPDGWTSHGICKKGDIVWTGKYRTRVEIDEDGLEVTRYRPIMTKAKADGVYHISDTQRYRALGNAVTTNVITFLGKRIMEAQELSDKLPGSWAGDSFLSR